MAKQKVPVAVASGYLGHACRQGIRSEGHLKDFFRELAAKGG